MPIHALGIATVVTAALILDAVVAVGGTTSDTLRVTLEECGALARERAPEVLAATAAAAAARADSAAISFNGRPTFALDGGAIVAPKWSYDPVVTNLGEYHLKLATDLPVFDGGRRARERLKAGLDASAAVASRSLAARDAALRAVEVAADLLRQRERERFLEEALHWVDRLATEVRSGVRSGGHGRADAERADLERSTVASDLVDTRLAEGTLERELLELIGRYDAPHVDVVDPRSDADRPPDAPDSVALAARAASLPVVRQAEIEEARLRVEIRDAERRNALQLGLAADAGLAGADLTTTVPDDIRASNPDATLADRLRRDLGASVSVSVTRPLADPSVRYAVIGRREALRAAVLRREAAVARARRETLDLIARWRAASDRVEIARSAAARADENLLRVRTIYAGGGIGLLDLLDARRQLVDARDRLAIAQLEARTARYQAAIP